MRDVLILTMAPNVTKGYDMDFVMRGVVCPQCGVKAGRHSIQSRRIKRVRGGTTMVRVSVHQCKHSLCPNKFFVNPELFTIKDKGRFYSNSDRRATVFRVIDMRVKGLTFKQISIALEMPISTLHIWLAEME